MPLLSKREWAGAAMLITGGTAVLIFTVSLVIGALWVHSAYSGPVEVRAIWAWVKDTAHHKDLEPLLAFMGLILSAVSAAFSFFCSRLRVPSPAAEAVAASKANQEWESIRGDLIKTVRSHWIDDYLRHSLVEGVRIRLGAEKTPEALDHPFRIERHSSGKTERLTDSVLLRLFDESGGSLLIQGEPGSGKTFTLVQLVGLLLEGADADPQAPVPVVVPLASWAVEQLPLEKWLPKELLHYYGLSARTTPGLLAEGKRLTLLLDGLDEVRESARPACLAAIQRFMENFTSAVVLCCRTGEYAALPARLSRGESIRVLPLTPEQIDKYLNDLDRGARLDPLRKMVKEDEHWRELASTPLMLNILAVVYATEDRLTEAPQTRAAARDAIFFRYVRQMLERKEHRTTDGQAVPEDAPFSKGQAVHWLQQIARRMVEEQSTTFYIERLQPRWVKSRWKFGLSSSAVGGLILGLCNMFYFGFYGVLFGGLDLGSFGLIVGLKVGIPVGLFVGAMCGLISSDIELSESVRFRFNRQDLAIGLIGGLICAVILGLFAGLIGGLILGLLYVVRFGLCEMRSHPQPARPNQGILNTIKTSLISAAVAGLFGSGIGLALDGGTFGAGAGTMIGLFFFGGGTVIEHYGTRLALAWAGTLPFPLRDRRLVAFLDAMRDRLILTRLGGGWVFIHRELMDYLATEPFGSTPAKVEQTLQSGKPPPTV